MALLEMTGVSKSFGGVEALRGVDFTLLAGQIHGMAGEQGKIDSPKRLDAAKRLRDAGHFEQRHCARRD